MCKFTEKKEKWNYLRFTIYVLLFILTFENELFVGKRGDIRKEWRKRVLTSQNPSNQNHTCQACLSNVERNRKSLKTKVNKVEASHCMIPF